MIAATGRGTRTHQVHGCTQHHETDNPPRRKTGSPCDCRRSREPRRFPPPRLSQSCTDCTCTRAHATEKQLSSKGDHICPHSAALTSKQSGQLSAAARLSTRANFALSMVSAAEKISTKCEVQSVVVTPRLFCSCLPSRRPGFLVCAA